MKIMRKGFTLVELLVVLAVIGILSATFTMSGREMTNIANANKIVEDFHVISSAMNMYYAHNTDACNDTTNPMDASTILTALKAYLKSTTNIVGDAETEGKFLITVNDDQSWWLTYQIPTSGKEQIARILGNRALQEGFVKEVGQDASNASNKYVGITESGNTVTVTDDTVVYQVR